MVCEMQSKSQSSLLLDSLSEKDIQKTILQYLTIRGYVCKRNNAGMAFANYNGKRRAIKIGESGWPDIEGITKETKSFGKGLYFGIEVKTKKGVLSLHQTWVGKRIIETGGIWFVARSVDDVIQRGF